MWWDDNEETPEWARELHELVGAEEWDKAVAMATAMLPERESGEDKALLYGVRGAIHVYHDRHDFAVADFTSAVEAAPAVMSNYLCRGMARLRKGAGEHDIALADFNRVLDVEADNPGAYCGRGWAYHDKGEFDLAVADLNRAIELAPDFAEAYFHRGNVRTSRSEYAPALADFNMALKLGAEDATIYILRGLAHGMLDDHKNAAADFERSMQLQPDHPMINDDMRELVKMHRQKAGGD